MTHVGIALDDVTDIPDFSNATLLALAERLDSSTGFQTLIVREIELDELWRRVETGMKAIATDRGARATRHTLQAIFDLVWQAHDLAGEGRPADAAARLRAAAALRANA
jgi:hypothetical protein